MCAIFTRKSGEATYYDGLVLRDGVEDRNFTAKITVKERQALKSIQGGRITEFMLFDSDNKLLCLYDDGRWQVPLDANDTMACFARTHFVSEYNSSKYKSKGLRYLRYLNTLENAPTNSDTPF